MADKTPAPPAEGSAARQAAVVSCWLCGIRQRHYQMVPDGGGACGDIRWYCKDARACTERWTSARRRARPPGLRRARAAAAPLSGPPSQPLPARPTATVGRRHSATAPLG